MEFGNKKIMNKLQHNIMQIKSLFIIHYSLCIIVILSFINCTKTPTTSNQTEQITVTGSITQNTVWQSGKDYIIEGVVTVEQGVSQQEDAWGIELDQSKGCGVFKYCRFEEWMYGVNVYEASVSVDDCELREFINSGIQYDFV